MDSTLFSDRSFTWPADVNYLRDVYSEIRDAWEQSGSDPAADEQLYKATEPKLNDLINGLIECIAQIPDRRSLNQEIQIAGSGQMTARAAASAGNWAQATTYQANALVKVRSILDTLTRIASKNVHQFVSSLTKKAYGYNQDGTVNEPGSGNPQHDSGKGNTRNPNDDDKHPENLITDGAALKEFPELAISYNHIPPRTY